MSVPITLQTYNELQKDLLLYGVNYRDENGQRVSPLNVVKKTTNGVTTWLKNKK